MNRRTGIFLVLLLNWVSALGQVPGSNLFDSTFVHEIRIRAVYDGLYDSMTNNYLFSFDYRRQQTRKIPYDKALITIDGTLLDTVGIRQKGYNSWWSSSKKPMKIDFDKYSPQAYDGLSKINLHNGAGDPTYLRENLCYHLMRKLKLKVPRTAFAKVYIDTTYLGLFRIVEQIDNTFLDINFGNHDGNLYVQQSSGAGGYMLDWQGSSSSAYANIIELENHRSKNDWNHFINFLDILNNSSDSNFRDEINSVFDVDEYLKSLAFDLVVNNWDWYGATGRNYYIVEANGKFHWLPWDYNLTWRDELVDIDVKPDEYPVLIKRILNDPAYHDKFIKKLCGIKSVLSAESIADYVDRESQLIAPLIEIDPDLEFTFEAFQTNLETQWDRYPGIKSFASSRLADVAHVLSKYKINCAIITGLPSAENVALSFYPQPANDQLTVEGNFGGDAQFTVLNSIGQVIVEEKGDDPHQHQINVDRLAPGFYVLKITSTQQTVTKPFLVAR